MKLHEVMTQSVRTVGSETSIRYVARIMEERGVGILPVVGMGDKVVGVVTDRDLVVRALARGLSTETPIRSIMTRDPKTVRPENSIDEALEMMEREAIGRVLVCDDQSRPIGVVALTDLATLCDSTCPTSKVSTALRKRDHTDEIGSQSILNLSWFK